MRNDLLQRRKALRLSQAYVGKLLGVSDQTISNIEREKYKSAELTKKYEDLLSSLELPLGPLPEVVAQPPVLPVGDAFSDEVLEAEVEKVSLSYEDPAEPTINPVNMFGTVVDVLWRGSALYIAWDTVPTETQEDPAFDHADEMYIGAEQFRFVRYHTLPEVKNYVHGHIQESIIIQGVPVDVLVADEQHWVGLQCLCDILGIDASSQRLKIVENPSFQDRFATYSTVTQYDTLLRRRFYITIPAMTRWLATIHPDRVDVAAREKLIMFQWEAESLLYEALFKRKSSIDKRELVTVLPHEEILQKSDIMLGMATAIHGKLDMLSEKIEYLEQSHRIREEQVKQLPSEHDVALSEVSLQRQFANVVQSLAYRRHIHIRDAYNLVYKTFLDRYHVDVKKRAELRKVSTVQVLVDDKLIDRAYALARELVRG